MVVDGRKCPIKLSVMHRSLRINEIAEFAEVRMLLHLHGNARIEVGGRRQNC